MRIIAGEWGGRRLTPLRGRNVRPTTDRVREAWMSAMGGRFPGWTVLDLFAGSGALGIECLSRGAHRVVFVERARSSLRVLRRNLELVGAGDRAEVAAADVFSWLGPTEEPRGGQGSTTGTPEFRAHVALADPPYGEGLAARLVERFLERPFANALWVEHAVRDPLPEAAGSRLRRYGDIALTHIPAPS